ncbi:hypothetical protein [uncultured Maribacter sp.]|uniref:hypothetical protein n=1 Tax=uncultured Maribacter sp. TaxID=431308 RepID=UPI0030EF9973|tara:strand:- start:52927 stop:53097 length:171 start_codon:yes stop_codon:yes gene_type:complete
MKQGTEETKFIKEPEDKTQEFILQKNKKTKIGVTILVVFLAILIIGILISNVFFNN